MAGREVGLELAEVPDFVGWGWLLTLPCSDMVARVAALALDLGPALVQQEVEEVGSPEPDAEGFHNESTSSPSNILWRGESASHTRCRLPGPCISVLASPISTVQVLIPGRPMILLLQFEVTPVIPFLLVPRCSLK